MARRTNHRDRPAAPDRSGSAARLLKEASTEQRAGRLAAAERQYRRVLAADPQNAEANYKLGVIASQTDRVAQAVPHFAAALKMGPDQPHYWLSLATALLGARRVGDARSVLERFAERRFADAETKATLTALIANLFTEAHQYYEARQFKDAEPLIDMIVMLDEGHVEALHMAGNIAAQTNRLALAIDLMSIAISLDDESALMKGNLGTILARQGRYGEANACFERSIAIDPDNPNTFSNFGVALRKQGRLRDAIDRFDEALRLDPGFAQAHSNRGSALMDRGELDAAIAAYDAALRIDPNLAYVHSNRLFTKLYAPDLTPEACFADAQAFGHRFADPLLRDRPFPNDRDPERRLRVGFVSGDFREHAVNYFFEPALRHLDTTQIETFASPTRSTRTRRRNGSRRPSVIGGWLCGLSDDEAADLIEADAIDILVDLSGHTAENRILVFARKPAPIQVAWIGYPGTTGCRPWITGSPIFNPSRPASATISASRRSGACRAWARAIRRPPTSLPLIDHPPSEDNGYVTFGCFNRFTKVSDAALEAWGRILHRVPGSKLLLEIADADEPANARHIAARLERLGVPLDRTIRKARSPSNRYVLYNQIDIALDPFPYNGGTSSLDTLWMGVPFIALEGSHFVSRMGHSILSNAGLPELSAPTIDAYVDLATRLALDAEGLRSVRHDLRARFAACPHMDHQLLADDVADAWRMMWRKWLADTAAFVTAEA